MLPVSRILVPVVFSDNCRGALQHAVTLAGRFGAELTILHVLEPLVCFETESTQALDYIDKCRREWALRQMKTLAFVAGARRRLAIRTAIIDGDPAREIVKFASADESDIIVMATHGHGPFRRFLLGSVTAKVLHDAACPVWTGAHLEQGLTPQEIEVPHVVCAVNVDDAASALLRWAGAVAAAFGSKLTVFHAVAETGDPVWAERELHRLSAAAGVPAEVTVEIGSPPAAICDAASRLNASLLVIGRGHEGGGVRLRSSSYALLHHCGTPVLSIGGRSFGTAIRGSRGEMQHA